MKYTNGLHKPHKRGLIIIGTIAGVLVVLLISSIVALRFWYFDQLKPIQQQSQKTIVIIPTGFSASQIADLLQEKGVIRSSQAFEWYVRSSNTRDLLQAGQYQLDANQSVQEIVNTITHGMVQKNNFTILPSQRLDQIKTSFIKAGFKNSEIDSALDPANYKNHPALVAKPKSTSLEGYLYPETFLTTSTTSAQSIILQSLDEMANVLTPELISQYQKQGLGIHDAITLASIVEQEVSNYIDRSMVAGVFLNRLRSEMMLGSDVTYHYAAIITHQDPTPFIDSPYNTRKYTGLPPGPISNVSKSSLDAVANPTPSDYLFFVAGDDGKTYFSKTQAEHEALAREHCKVLCSTY